MQISEIYYPASASEMLDLLHANPDILIVAGGTGIVGTQTSRSLNLPPQVASIAKLQELRKTVRTEQFLEVGSCTTLTGLLTLSQGSLPEPLPDVIRSIANHAVRNIATIGGNLCCRYRFMDLWPFLACMEAQIEIRSVSGARWVSVFHLSDEAGSPSFPRGTLLSRIRIPLHSYNFVFHRKLGAMQFPGPDTGCFVCMADVERGKIEAFKLVFAGEKAFRLKDKEMAIIGKKTALGQKEIQSIIDDYVAAFAEKNFQDKRLFLSLIEEAFGRLFA